MSIASSPPRRPAARSRRSVLAGCSRATAACRRRRRRRHRVVLPAAVRGRAGRRRPGQRADVADAAGAEPHDLELSPAQVSPDRHAPTSSSTCPASRPRSTTRSRRPAPGARRRRRDATRRCCTSRGGHEDETEERARTSTSTATSTRTSGSTRAGCRGRRGRRRHARRDRPGRTPTTFAAERRRAARQQFEDLDAAYADGLAQLRPSGPSSPVHEAFGYLADRVRPGAGRHLRPRPRGRALTGPARRGREDRRASEDVTTIFFETLVSPKVAETLAADLGVDTAVLDPIEGLADPDDRLLLVARCGQPRRPAAWHLSAADGAPGT